MPDMTEFRGSNVVTLSSSQCAQIASSLLSVFLVLGRRDGPIATLQLG